MTSTEHGRGDLDEAVATFLRVRPRLMAIGYRILASTSEAEDIVQETWLRWQRMDRTVVTKPHALLATIAIRLAINVSQSASRRRETPMSPSTAERIDAGKDVETMVEDRDAVERALLVVLESLAPKERAAFVLREAFEYSYEQISDFLHLESDNSRQLVCRARRRVATAPQASLSPASYEQFLHAFIDAARSGELTGFEKLLAADLVA
ncbi:sigma-70 family RNA polymerase sigma factor [Kribbella sp. C-35]|uniref:sigma-70 family RNA polymerase sigma factor n=1 Tax=Kribbella sp. C-35 TaxID=2789276 RepID=UPI00397C2C23